MNSGNPNPPRRRARRSKLVIRYVFAWVIAGALLSAGEMLFVGRLTAPVLGVDLIAAIQFPLGLLAAVLSFDASSEEGPSGEEDDDDRRGGSPPRSNPLPPSGGLNIDWPRFEAEFQAYAQGRELLV